MRLWTTVLVLLLSGCVLQCHSVDHVTLVAYFSDDSSQANVLLKVDDSLAADPVRRMICTPGQVTLLATGQSGLFQNIALRTLNRETKPLIVNYYKAASLFEPCESGNRRMISLSDETQRSIDFEDVEDVLFTMDQSFSIDQILGIYRDLAEKMPGRVQLVLTSPNFSIGTKTSSQMHLLKRALTSDLMAAQNSTFFQRNKLFSGGIFMGLLTSLILIIVMVISLRCLLSVQSPLRFEKPVKVKQ